MWGQGFEPYLRRSSTDARVQIPKEGILPSKLGFTQPLEHLEGQSPQRDRSWVFSEGRTSWCGNSVPRSWQSSLRAKCTTCFKPDINYPKVERFLRLEATGTYVEFPQLNLCRRDYVPFRWIISRVTAKSNPTKMTHLEVVNLYYCHNSRKLHQNAGTWV